MVLIFIIEGKFGNQKSGACIIDNYQKIKIRYRCYNYVLGLFFTSLCASLAKVRSLTRMLYKKRCRKLYFVYTVLYNPLTFTIRLPREGNTNYLQSR
jgi:hypothetical protein